MEMLPSIIGLVIALAGPPLISFYGTRLARGSLTLTTNLLCQLALLGLLAAVLVIVLVWEGAPLLSLGFRGVGLSTIMWGIGIAALFVFGFGPIIMRVPRWFGLSGFEKPLEGLRTLPLWYLILAIIVGGTVEEILYRGFAIEHLASLVGSYWAAAAVIVVLSGIAHVPLWGWAPALTTAFSGAVLTAFYLWHRDIAANIMAHVATDFVGITLPVLLAKGGAARIRTGSDGVRNQ